MDAALLHMDGPFDRAAKDCWRSAAAAFEELWSINPMGPHGYRTLGEAKAVIRAGGGRDAYCARLAGKAGLVEAGEGSGLIGIVEVPDGSLGWCGGLCIEPGVWAVKTGDGLTFLPKAIRAWGVPWA